jgi:RNA polymerase sigma factor (sigma-70 family)
MVERLLVQLSPRQREVLTLYYWDEKNYEDICKIMNMNYQSVRNLMHRSLTKLRSLVNYA